MNYSGAQTNSREETPEQRMWKAVLATTVDEWLSGPLRRSLEAEEYLFNNEPDFRQVCHSAGLDPDQFRSRLQRLRETGARRACTHVSHN